VDEKSKQYWAGLRERLESESDSEKLSTLWGVDLFFGLPPDLRWLLDELEKGSSNSTHNCGKTITQVH